MEQCLTTITERYQAEIDDMDAAGWELRQGLENERAAAAQREAALKAGFQKECERLETEKSKELRRAFMLAVFICVVVWWYRV